MFDAIIYKNVDVNIKNKYFFCDLLLYLYLENDKIIYIWIFVKVYIAIHK